MAKWEGSLHPLAYVNRDGSSLSFVQLNVKALPPAKRQFVHLSLL